MASVTKTRTSSGETRYRVRYRDPEGQSREKWLRTKAKAEKYARNVETDIDRGDYIDPQAGRITLGEWIAQHEATKTHRRPSTAARDESLIRNHVLPAFAHRQIKTITPIEVRSWVADLSAEGLAADTTRKAHQLLAGALEAAADDGLIPRNPARRVDLPRVERQEMRFLSPTEIGHLATTIDPRYRALVVTAAYSGCRFGELAALRVDRLDMLRRTLRVEETLSEVKGKIIVGPPKTRAAVRSITLPKIVIDELAQHLAAYPPGPDRLVFTGSSGGPVRSINFRSRVWAPAVRASVGQPLRFHDLRHSHAALLVAARQHPKVIQERLGHSSIKTTLDVYGHLFEGLDRQAADALDGLAENPAVGLSWG